MSRVFRTWKEAEEFKKEIGGGFTEVIMDDKLNKSFIVFYKGSEET